MKETNELSPPTFAPGRQQTGVSVPFDTINSPGAYICNWNGHLLRIPERSVKPGQPLKVSIVGNAPLTVTKISDDPDVSLDEARSLAGTYGASAGF